MTVHVCGSIFLIRCVLQSNSNLREHIVWARDYAINRFRSWSRPLGFPLGEAFLKTLPEYKWWKYPYGSPFDKASPE